MISSSTKIRPTNKSNCCPVCGDTKGKCRTIDSEPIVLCGNTAKGDEPSGWSYRKPASNPLWNVFAPDDGNDSQSWQDKLQERNKHNAERTAAKAQRLAENPVAGIVDRDNGYRHLLAVLPAKLNVKDQADLARRGVTPDQIDQWQIRSIDQWQRLSEQVPERLAGISEGGRSLSNGCEGYIVPIEDPLGRVSGFQICNRRKGDDQPKYPWFSSRNKRNLNGATSNFANEELPLAVAFPERLDLSKLGQIGLCEGTGVKPRIAANKIGIPFIGAAGGHFGKETLSDYIKQLEEILSCVNQEDYGEVWLSLSRQQWRNISKYSNSTKTATETAASHTLSMKTSPSKAVALNSQQPGSKSDESTQNGEQHSTNTESGSICDASKKAKPIRAKILIFPDAGSPENPTVMAIAANTFKICWDLKYKPTVRWWGQFSKPGRDVDELDGSENIRTLAGSQFLSLSNWRSLKKFTPNQTIEGVFCDFPSPEPGQMIAVRAGLGAGKTWRAIEILKSAELSAIVVTPTNTLGRNFVGRAIAAGLNETYHFQSDMNVETGEEKETDASDSKPKAPKKNKSMFGQHGVKTFTLCPDSIVNLDPKALTNQIVIVDEAMQNWVALLQRQTAIKGWRTRTRKVLIEILEVCHSVILLDGGLTDKCCEFWSELAPSKDLVKIQHIKTDFESFNISLIEAPGDAEFLANVQTIALQNVAFRDEPFAILSDSKKDLEAFDRRFAAMGLKGYLLDSSTCSEPWAKELIANPDKFIEESRPDYLLISPVASSGFDCSIRGYFKYAFLLSRGVLAIDDLMQHLARIRDPKVKRVIWCPPIGLSGGHPVVNELTIGECQAALVKYITDDATLGVGDLSEFSKRMEEIATQARQQGALIATDNIERKNLRSYLHEALLLAGHTVQAGVVTEEDRSACKAQADTKATIKVEKAQVIHAAEELTTIEAEALKSKDSLNAEERAKMSRYRILNDLPGITNSQEWNSTDQVAISKRVSCEARFKFVNDLLENNLISKARSWYLWQNPDAAAAISRDKWAKILDGGEVKRLKSMELYLDALRSCGFEAVLGLDVITNDDPVLAHFLMNCRKKANRLKLSKTAKSLSDQNRTLALRNLIEQLGLVLIQAEEHDGRSDRIYKIESEIPASVMASTEAKIEAKTTQKTEETDEKKTGSADAGNPFSEGVRGATEGHTDPYKNRRPSVADVKDEFIPVENTIETEPDSPDWMSEESLQEIRNQWNESESDDERETWRQIIPAHVLEAAIAA